MKIGRNDLCPCGSGLKYKNCCLKYAKNGLNMQNINSIVKENQGSDIVKKVFYKMYEIQKKRKMARGMPCYICIDVYFIKRS